MTHYCLTILNLWLFVKKQTPLCTFYEYVLEVQKHSANAPLGYAVVVKQQLLLYTAYESLYQQEIACHRAVTIKKDTILKFKGKYRIVFPNSVLHLLLFISHWTKSANAMQANRSSVWTTQYCNINRGINTKRSMWFWLGHGLIIIRFDHLNLENADKPLPPPVFSL